MRLLSIIFLCAALSGCLSIPQNVAPVDGFELNKYLGKWYEIARLDHSFERGLDNVTAEYFLRDDGGVRVINKGFSTAENKWKEAEGKAYFVSDPQQGFLKVSFFGPFYGAYIVFELDKEDYQYTFVTSYDKSYLWLLARTPVVSDELRDRFMQKAAELGFATDKLIFPKQD
ncbi:lipocalin family protein [Nitrosomonas oligotropha]|uniref:Outer membrane lipoprotein Blc n=1 Tax=Nitrosomonas oligotropha TaxID=42354 RepID=A0A1H8TP77_9PROT|nr:lipocalin family protein [Nitrosomonas oligotropha]SDX33286.1 apolipoprotein D and lipocalin family protein [Nitrosomonas oligotropha]SEO92258.1 apolipoprotein D and lipocalin family protein [Nitrosomonas oligotropha]